MNRKLILLVEDDKKVQNFNRGLLESRGFAVQSAVTLAEAREAVKKRLPNAVVLDIGMPDGSGLDFLRELRKTSKVTVLLLTGYGKDEDVIAGFECGCNDYLTKPYTFGVLFARLNNLLNSAEQLPETVSKGKLTIKPFTAEAYVNGVNLLLTPRHFSLLQYFVQNENQLVNSEQVYEAVWGQPMAGNSQALNSAVSRLRKKLVGCGYTVSVEYGTGYRFERWEP